MELAALCALSVAMFTPAAAQENVQAMDGAAEHLRATATQMRSQLSAAEIAEMLRSAEEIEQRIAEWGFSTARLTSMSQGSKAPPLSEKIRSEHERRLDWLARGWLISASYGEWPTTSKYRRV